MDYKLIFQEHGQMHPDYFQGTSGVQINLTIHNKMTKEKVLQMLKMELDFIYDHIGYTLFEAKGKLIPNDLEKKIDDLLESIIEKNKDTLSDKYSTYAPNEKEIINNEEVAPFIFTINSKFKDN